LTDALTEVLPNSGRFLEVAAAAVRCDGRLLICRRPEGKAQAGYWELPGGKREAGESLADCLRREIAEELCIEVDVGNEIGCCHHQYTDYRVALTAFWVDSWRGDIVASEHDALRWISASELHAVQWAPADVELLPLVASGLAE